MSTSINQSQRNGAYLACALAMLPMRCMVAVFLAVALVMNAPARAVRHASVPELCKLATVVVVGEVESIKPSGIEVSLSYPAVDQVTFHWLQVRVKVFANLKGEALTNSIDVAMLEVLKNGEMMFNGPLMLKPKKGQKYAMFLTPSSKQGLWVSLFAPYDEESAVFLLDRTRPHYDMSNVSTNAAVKKYRDMWQEIRDMVWSLVDAEGKFQPAGIESFRKRYERDLQEPAGAKPVALEWEKFTNKAGWSVDVPKGSQSTNKEPNEVSPPPKR